MNASWIVIAVAGLGAGSLGMRPSPADVVLEGVVREAVSGKLLSNVSITVGFATATSDSSGRFLLHVSAMSQFLAVYREGYHDFQYPMLNLRRDTVRSEIELRTDPMSPEMYVRGRFIPSLCIIDDDAELVVRHGCSTKNFTAYHKRTIKHNPWNPYFGSVEDGGGVFIATRVSPR